MKINCFIQTMELKVEEEYRLFLPIYFKTPTLP